MKKLKGFLSDVFHDSKKSTIAIVIIVVILVAISLLFSTSKEDKARQEALDRAAEQQKKNEELAAQNSTETVSEDAYLIQIQESLVQSFGALPEGYIWNVDGTLLSLGDKNMTSEEVVYAYLNGLRTLDLSIAQKYSRGSRVVQTYSSYFENNTTTNGYYESFIRNMYKEVLLSIEPGEIVDSSVFAENKQVFTVKLNVLDLSSKDFWVEDKEMIYNNLYIYSNDEEDSTKGDIFLYDYVLNYYRSPDAVTKDVYVNITVEKYPDLDTGWLVSIDTDINDICTYSDGNLIVNYIRRMFSEEGRDFMEDKTEEDTSSEESTTEVID